MKYLLLKILLFIALSGASQEKYDSVEVRVYNIGKHKIQKIIITTDGNEYSYSSIKKYKFTEYQKMPYIWATGN